MQSFIVFVVFFSLAFAGVIFYEMARETWGVDKKWILLVLWMAIPLIYVLVESSVDDSSWVLALMFLNCFLPRRACRQFVLARFEQCISDIPFYDKNAPNSSGWVVVFWWIAIAAVYIYSVI